ncbi:MAG: leucine-rich repeat domain-containing protein [Muribaculaceae bacterium]|nr:leucine-rich repeat domain-containing protein [Muribaculaceae bacterium]
MDIQIPALSSILNINLISSYRGDDGGKHRAMRRFILYLFLMCSFVAFPQDVLIEFGDYTYRLVSLEDRTVELYKVPYEHKVVEVPASITYNAQSLTVIGVNKGAYDSALANGKGLKIVIGENCKYIQGTSSSTTYIIDIVVPSLAHYLTMTSAPLNNKRIYTSDGQPLPSVLRVPDSVEDITCENAFSRCSQIVEFIWERRFNEGSMKDLPRYMFYECKSIESITVPSVSIGSNALDECTALREVSILDMGEYSGSISGCKSLRKINGQLKGNPYFYGCTSLVEIRFAKGTHLISSIGYYNWMYNNSWERTIEMEGYRGVFTDCVNLSRIYFPDMETLFNTTYSDMSSSQDGQITYLYQFFPANAIFKSHAGEIYVGGKILTECIAPNGISKIPAGLFYNVKGIRSVDLSNITEIGDYAFANTDLVTLYVPSTVNKIGEHALDAKVVELERIPENNEDAKKSLIYNNTGRLIIHEYDRPCIFADSKQLGSVEIWNLTADIAKWAFENCPALATFTCRYSKDGLKINRYAFSNTSSLKYIKIPEGVTEIDRYAFGNSGLQTLEFAPRDELSLYCYYYDYQTYNPLAPHSASFQYCNINKLILDECNGGWHSYHFTPFNTNYCHYTGFYPWPNSNIEVVVFRNTYSADVDFYVTGSSKYYLNSEGCSNRTESVLRELDFGEGTCLIYLNGGNSLLSDNANWASYDKSQIEKITVRALNPPTVQEGGFSDWSFMNAQLLVPQESLEVYRQDPLWGKFWNIQGADLHEESGLEDAVIKSAVDERQDVYTLQGVCVMRKASADDIKKLVSGFYIIGGRKVFVR